MTAIRSLAANRAGLKHNEEKWTRELLAAGWSMIPTVLLERQRILKLDATDLNILLHLVKHWWYAENLPHPSKQSIAECMGIDPSTVRRHIAKLEKRKLVMRIARSNKQFGQQTNEYDLSGLIEQCRPLADEIVKTRENRKKEDADRRIRRRPELKIVPNE